MTAIKIQTRFEPGLKLSSVVRSCLGLSVNQLKQMIEAKAIFIPGDFFLKKHKAKDGDRVWISKEQLLSIYKGTL